MFRHFGILIITLCAFVSTAFSQKTIIKGTVIDAATQEPIPFASVYIPYSTSGTTTDTNGFFQFSTSETNKNVEASFIGYIVNAQTIVLGTTNTLRFELKNDANTLADVVVKSNKKYRNKNNPAVELIKKVIEHKEENKISSYDFLSFKEYEKVQFSLSNNVKKLKRNILLRKYSFLASGIDTTKIEGKGILPLYLAETVSNNFLGFRPERKKKIILAEKKVSFNKDFIDGDGVYKYLKHIYKPIDIYENNIMVATNQFLSPISDLAPTFYKFYINDTVEVNGEKLINLYFSPRNSADYMFMGNMFITLDGHYAIQRISMKLNKNINLNWINNLRILQDFEKDQDHKYHLSKSSLAIDFGLTKNSDGGMYGERIVSFKDYKTNKVIPDSIFSSKSTPPLVKSTKRSDSILAENRNEKINYSEQMVYRNMDSLQNLKSFQRTLNILTTVLAGYTRVTKGFELGPINTFYSYNNIEGFRLRAGGRTTLDFNKNIYLEGYGAYGFKDQQWKYYIGGTYSFSGKSRFEFPVKKINVSYQHDTKIPGREIAFIQEDNILLSLKRGVNNKLLYNDIFKVDYEQEFKNNFSYKLGFKNWRQIAAGELQYIQEGTNELINNITTTEFSTELRWAPNERFYQGKSYRTPFPNRYPIFTFSAVAGVKGILESEYDYQRINLNIFKRVYLSQLGFTDIKLDGGYIFGKLPYPLLHVPSANQTYSYQLESYNLMNFLEFATDHYVGVQLEQNFNGFIFNKIPLVKRLKLREFISAKVLYGGLRAENIPGPNNPNLLTFPTDNLGNPTTFNLSKQPYFEGSIGIGNIFKFFRIDVVKRFTHLTNPNVTEIGIRGRFKFDF